MGKRLDAIMWDFIENPSFSKMGLMFFLLPYVIWKYLELAIEINKEWTKGGE